MPNHQHSGKQPTKGGYILGATLVLMLVFVISCASFLNFTYMDTREATEKENSLTAFWTAQSGNNRTIRKLELDPNYRAAPGIHTNIIANTFFTTEIDKSFYTYTVTTVSSNHTGKHTVEEIIETTPLGWHATYSNFVAVAYNGSIQVNPTATINGAQADSGDASPPTLPGLNVAYIKYLIDYAGNNGINPIGTTINLAGNDIFIDGDQTISSITGPGRLIAKGHIILNANATIGPDITLVSEQRINALASVAIGANCTFLSADDIFFGPDNHLAAPSALIAGDDISVGIGSTINGTLFAIDNINLASNVTISGSVLCDGNLTVAEQCFINHDTGQFMPRVPEGIEGTPEHIALRKNWTDR